MLQFRCFLSLFTLCLSFSLFAQRAYKPIRVALKNKDAAQALELITPLLNDSNYNHDSRLYKYRIEANLLIHEKENTRAYLKQKYDTLQFFNSSLAIVQNILILDSLEKDVRTKRERNILPYKEIIPRFLSHINTAGRYFYKRKQYDKAILYFSTYLSTPNNFFSQEDTLPSNKYLETAYLCTRSYLLNQQYQEVTKYDKLLLSTSPYHCSVLEIYALAVEHLKNERLYLEYLQEGVETCFPVNFFFTRLLDYYISNNRELKALTLADSLLLIDSTNIVIMEGRCLALIALQKYTETISQAERILEIDKTATYPNYYIGVALCNLANSVVMPTSLNSREFKKADKIRKEYYNKALPYLERFRREMPMQTKMWAPLLYKVYLSQENETKFQEIDALMKTL